jgi:hypothetical protein
MKFWICDTCHGNYSEKWIGEDIVSTTSEFDFCCKCGIFTPTSEIVDVEVSIVGETVSPDESKKWNGGQYGYTYWQILGLITSWIQDPPKEI